MVKRKIQATIIFLLLLVGNEAWGQYLGDIIIGSKGYFTIQGGMSSPATYVWSVSGSGFSGSETVTLNGGATRSFNAVLTPTTTTNYTGSATIIIDGTLYNTYSLSGTGVATSTLFSSINLNFGDVPINTTVTQNITITNTRNTALTIVQLINNSYVFTFGSTVAITLQPNTTHNLLVNFTPTTIGNKTGIGTLKYNTTTQNDVTAQYIMTTINYTGTGAIPIATNTIPIKQMTMGDK